MVRRRSTVRFRNGDPLKDQVRSSLDSSPLTLWMGARAVLGGIWEIVFCASHGRLCSSGPTERARSARKAQAGDAGLHGGVDQMEPDPSTAVPCAIRDNACELARAESCVPT